MTNFNSLFRNLRRGESHLSTSCLLQLRYAAMVLFILTIGSGNVWGTDLTFNSFSGLGSSSYTSGSTTSSPITLASSGWYGASATELRIKSGETVTISCTSSYKITKIVFTATGASRANLNSPVVWSGTTGTYTNASGTTSVTFSNSAQCRFSKIVVTYSAAASCDKKVTLTKGAQTNGSVNLNHFLHFLSFSYYISISKINSHSFKCM